MAERARILAVTAKLETTYGTDAAPTLALNAVRPIGIPILTVNYLDEGVRADEQHAGLGTIGVSGATGRWGQVDIELALKGAGADYSVATNRPEWDPFLQAAGFSATETGGSGSGTMTYTTLDSGAFSSITLYLYSANKLYKLVGCVCLPKISLEAAKRATIKFTCMGICTSITESTIAAQTLSSVAPLIFANQTVSIGPFTSALSPGLVARKLDIDFGTAHVPRPSAGATDGIAGFLITDRMVKCSGEIEVVPLSSFDPTVIARQAFPASGSPVLTNVTAVLGTVQYNTIQVLTGQWQWKGPKVANAGGLMLWQLDGSIIARSITGAQGLGREIALYCT